jgi:hypothetical protein
MFDGTVSATRADVLGVDTAGIEAQNVLADAIGRQALLGGRLSYREAWLYLQSRIAGLLYIRGVSPRSPPGDDVADFLQDFNDGCLLPSCAPLAASTLKRRVLLMLADPILAQAAYGFAVSYVVHGQPSTSLPTIPLPGGLRYLPAVGFAMTPYGTEWTTAHNFLSGNRLMRFSVRSGAAGAAHPWGLGVVATNVAHVGPAAADVSVEIWRQPPFDALPTAAALLTGGLAATTLNVPLGRGSTLSRLGVTGEVGYKSAGFVAGERLRAGPILRVGLTIALGGSPRSGS